MKPLRRLASGTAILLLLAFSASAGVTTRPHGSLAAAIGARLQARRPLRPQTHTTDFAGEELGCITLTTHDMRHLGYRGHAFACEAASTGEVVGAVLSRAGVVRCYIVGGYIGEGCYDIDICDVPETICFE